MKAPKISRRQFLAAAVLATPGVVWGDTKYVEPTWLRVRHERLGGNSPTHRLVHFSDLHYKGDRPYLNEVINTINSLTPDFVCFTGDIMEKGEFLPEALEGLSQIKAPLFGVPGNHDFWAGVSFAPIEKCFSGTGGGWLLDQHREIAGGTINLIGLSCNRVRQPPLPLNPLLKNVVLMHYPAWVKNLFSQRFDLVLAGHSHGGQVRIPFFGPLVLPYAVDGYDWGLFQTDAGPLYVNAGIGYIGNYDIRFNCRPEITVIEI